MHSDTVTFDPTCKKCWQDFLENNWPLVLAALGIVFIFTCIALQHESDAQLPEGPVGNGPAVPFEHGRFPPPAGEGTPTHD